MPPTRRIAVMVDPGQLGFREQATLRGIARFADAARWCLALDPFAVFHPPGRCDGMIVPTRIGVGGPITRCPVPVVGIAWSQSRSHVPRVVENRFAAGRLAAGHLVERGYRTFAYLGFTRNTQSCFERQGFSRALRRLGRRIASARTFKSYAQIRRWWDKVMAELGRLLGRLEPPVGLFVAQPGFARSLARLALDRGLRIPRDVGIVAADNDPVVCELPPSLTSIHFDYAQVGYRAAELLARLIEGAPPPKGAVLIPPTLVPRQSTDRQGVGDLLVAKALWFIDSRRTEPIRPSGVAAALGVGERTLQRRFRQAGRDTVRQEITKARVEHAKLHLARGLGSLPAIARDCGFASRPAMSRAFRQHAGMPPSAWRRQAQVRRRGAEDAEEPSSRRGPRGTRGKHDSPIRDP